MLPMPGPRYLHSCIIKKGKLIVLGGVGGDDGTNAHILMINLDDDLGSDWYWNVIKSKEIGRRYNPIFIPLDEKNTRILVAGGNRGGNYKADAYIFDMKSKKVS